MEVETLKVVGVRLTVLVFLGSLRSGDISGNALRLSDLDGKCAELNGDAGVSTRAVLSAAVDAVAAACFATHRTRASKRANAAKGSWLVGGPHALSLLPGNEHGATSAVSIIHELVAVGRSLDVRLASNTPAVHVNGYQRRREKCRQLDTWEAREGTRTNRGRDEVGCWDGVTSGSYIEAGGLTRPN